MQWLPSLQSVLLACWPCLAFLHKRDIKAKDLWISSMQQWEVIEKSWNLLFLASFTQIQIFLKLHTLLHESAFRPHETNESALRNRIFSKSFPRVINGPVHTNLGKRIGGFIKLMSWFVWTGPKITTIELRYVSLVTLTSVNRLRLSHRKLRQQIPGPLLCKVVVIQCS